MSVPKPKPKSGPVAPKPIADWTRADFEALPTRKWNEDVGLIDAIVILPRRKIHDSGYRMMDFAAIRGNTPFCLLSGCSDALHFEGIGGMGKFLGDSWAGPEAAGWLIDCLPKSGLLRLFLHEARIEVDPALSSFAIYSRKVKK